jgi:hypothetical protein
MNANRTTLFNPLVIKPTLDSLIVTKIQKTITETNPRLLKKKEKLSPSPNLTNKEGTVNKIQEDSKIGRKLSFSLAKK